MEQLAAKENAPCIARAAGPNSRYEICSLLKTVSGRIGREAAARLGKSPCATILGVGANYLQLCRGESGELYRSGRIEEPTSTRASASHSASVEHAERAIVEGPDR